MKNILKKIGLIESFRLEIPIQKQDFVQLLRANIDPSQSDFSDIFSSSKNQFKGKIYDDGFEIRRKRKLIDMNPGFGKVKGTFQQRGELLVIEAEVNGFIGQMIPYYAFCLLIYPFIIAGLIFSESDDNGLGGFALPFIFLHGSFMVGIPYFMMRSSVNNMKRELERELYFITKPQSSNG